VDFHYEFAGKYKGQAAVVLRLALLRKTSAEAVERGTRRLLYLWRKRVLDLARAGWKPAAGVRCQYLRNCPPSVCLVTAGGRARALPCHRSKVCPWCWGREVCLSVYAPVADAARHVPDWRLYSSTATAWSSDPAALWDGASAVAMALRRKLPRDAGLARVIAVWPAREGGFRLSLRLLALSPTPPSGKWHVARPNRCIVAVAHLARYPSAFLFCDPGAHAAALDAVDGRRSLALSGSFVSRRRKIDGPA
jgi:hypothetical protein